MSYNYYCYGQIKDEKGNWKEFSKQSFADNLKYYIDFDSIPDCLERVSFNNDSDFDKENIAKYFMDKYRPDDGGWGITEGFVVRLDKFVEYYANKVSIINAKIGTIFSCMGLDTKDFNLFDEDDFYSFIELNEEKKNKTTLPIAKNAIFDLIRCISDLQKYQYLLNIAHVFETLTYEAIGLDNDKRSLLIVME